MKHLPLSHLHNKLDGKSAKNKKRKTLKCASKSAFYWTVCMQFMFMYHLDLPVSIYKMISAVYKTKYLTDLALCSNCILQMPFFCLLIPVLIKRISTNITNLKLNCIRAVKYMYVFTFCFF